MSRTSPDYRNLLSLSNKAWLTTSIWIFIICIWNIPLDSSFYRKTRIVAFIFLIIFHVRCFSLSSIHVWAVTSFSWHPTERKKSRERSRKSYLSLLYWFFVSDLSTSIAKFYRGARIAGRLVSMQKGLQRSS